MECTIFQICNLSLMKGFAVFGLLIYVNNNSVRTILLNDCLVQLPSNCNRLYTYQLVLSQCKEYGSVIKACIGSVRRKPFRSAILITSSSISFLLKILSGEFLGFMSVLTRLAILSGQQSVDVKSNPPFFIILFISLKQF